MTTIHTLIGNVHLGRNAWSMFQDDQLGSNISAEEKEILLDSSPQDFIDAVALMDKAHANQSKTRRVYSTLRPCIDIARRAGPAMDVLAGAEKHGIVSLIWGSIRLILIAVEKYMQYFDEVAKYLNDLSGTLEILQKYEKVLGSPEPVARVLKELFANFWDFCRNAQSFFKKSNSVHSRLWGPKANTKWKDFKKNAEQRVEAINSLGARVRDEVRIEFIRSNQQSNALSQNKTEGDKFRDLCAWLSPVSSTLDDFKKISSKQQDGSCSWIEEDAQVSSFIKDIYGKHRILWINGQPGSGKTHISAHLIDLLQRQLQHRTAYFFCKTQAEEKRSLLSILRTWAWQLLTQIPASDVGEAIKLSEFHNKGQILTTDFAASIILNFFDEKIPTWLVLDGLDECFPDDRKAFLNICHDLSEFYRFIIVTRDEPEEIASMTLHVQVTEEATRLDVENYISKEINVMISRSKSLDPGVKAMITTTLSKNTRGMFLWANMMCERLSALCEHGDKTAIIEALNKTPPDIYNFYIRTLDEIAHLDPLLRRKAHRILQWLVCAYRPLTITELEIASSIDTEQNDIASWENGTNYRNTLKILCGPFVDVDQETEVVSFAHASVKDFLLLQDHYAELSINPRKCHAYLSRACLSYLSHEARPYVDISCDSDPETAFAAFQRHLKLKGNVLLKYSSLYWCQHLSECGDLDGTDCQCALYTFVSSEDALLKWLQLCCHFQRENDFSKTLAIILDALNPIRAVEPNAFTQSVQSSEANIFKFHLGWAESGRFSRWQRLMQWKWETLRDAPLVFVAAYFDFDRIMQMQIDVNPDAVKSRNLHGFTPLMLAARGGSINTLQKVLQYDVPLDVQTKNLQRTAIFEAVDDLDEQSWSGSGSYEAASLLLTAGCDLNISTVDGQNPMHGLLNACKDEEPQVLIARELVRSNVNLTEPSWTKGSCLFDAVIKNFCAIVEAILAEAQAKYGRDAVRSVIDRISHDGRSLLEVAILRENFQISQSLVDAGANVNPLTYQMQRSPLHLAVIHLPDLVPVLLNRKANLSAADSFGEQPVHLAAVRHSSVLTVLIQAGADLESRNADGERPLDIARRHEREDAVNTLLEAMNRSSNALNFASYHSYLIPLGGMLVVSTGLIVYLRTIRRTH